MIRPSCITLTAAIFCVLAFHAVPAFSETEEERQVRIERHEALKATEDVTGSASRVWSQISKNIGWYVDYGGNIRLAYTGGRDNDRSLNTPDALAFTKDYELSAFLNLTDLTRKSKIYGRFRTTYTERKKNSASSRGNEWVQLEVDAAYYERKYRAGLTNTTLTIGRQFTSVGRGIAYSAAADGIIINTVYKRGDLTMFAVKADRSPDDADPGNISPPSRNHTHRNFIGGELKLSVSPRFNPSVYVVQNNDRSPNRVDPQTSEVHLYQPRFVGFGAQGSITRSVSYFAEYIRVSGKTTSAGQRTDTARVDAQAADIGIRARLPGMYNPVLTAEWLYGSGDRDRTTTVNSTLLGDRNGVDRAFRPFGGASLGYALAPTLVNIRARKYGVSAIPFPRSGNAVAQSMQFTSEYYLFDRDVTPGPISDLSAFADARAQKRIGKELNAQINCTMMGDVRLNVKWGKFVPHGDSYGTTSGDIHLTRDAVPEIYWKVQWTLDI